MKDLKTSIKCSKVDNCSLTLVLDKRTNKATDVYPLAICFQIAAKRYYYKLKDMDYQSEKYFNDVCSVKGAKSLLMPVRTEWQNVLEGYREKVEKLSQRQPLTLELIRTYLSGEAMEEHHETSFIGVWEGIIAKMKAEDRVGTAENYQWALNSFQKYAGDVRGFKVDKNVINKWNDAMQNGVYIDGVLTGKIADATRGMYLRTCRVVWNECIRQGFLTEDKYPFSNKDKTLISIPRGKRRQQSYLSVDEMTKLYQVFTEKNYPDTWDPAYKARAHESLGLFLAQYLCNGFNLTDAGRLQYNRTYFAEGGKAFEFMRKKTSARSNDMSVVIVPIIEPLQVILDEIGAKPEKDAYVFPQIFKGVTDESQRRKMTVQVNSNIKDRMIRICKDVLGWDKVVSGTWARHSFATNLTHAGVERSYIQESMGHSQSQSVTDRYIANYPLEKQMEYNSKLLNLNPTQTITKKDIKKMSKAEMAALLTELMEKK